VVKSELKARITKLAAFPKDRSQPYQSYFLKDEGYIKGSRDTLYRFDVMGIAKDLTGKTVLDLGSQLGSMGLETRYRGAINVLGVEFVPEYVDCANALVEYNEVDNTKFVIGDLNKSDELEILKQKLEMAVEKQNFEEAVELRDKIKNLEENKEKISELNKELEDCIKIQDFEKAIELRDRINTLK
jgi:16S rRNA G966 N2-methylase RsmD